MPEPPLSLSAESTGFKSVHSLRNKLLKTFLPVALAPLMLAGGLATLISYRRATQQANLKLHERAVLAAEFTNRDIESTIDFLKILSIDPLVLNTVRAANQDVIDLGLNTVSIDELEARFAEQKLLKSNPPLTEYLQRIAPVGGFAEIFITELHGLNVAYTQPTSDFVQRDEYWWQQGQQQGKWIGNPSFDESSQAVTVDLVYAVQDPDTEEFLGVIKGGYDAANLDVVAEELEKLQLKGSEQLQIVQLGESPTAIATLTANGLSPDQTLILAPAILSQTIGLQGGSNGLETAEGSMSIFKHQGQQYAVAPIADTDWLVVVSASWSEIHATAHQLAWMFGLIVLGLGVLAQLIVRKLASQVATPLGELAQIAQQVTENADFSKRAPILSQDEVGVLAHAFNRLMAWTGTYIEDLNTTRHTLEERTQNLTSTLKELTQTQLQLVQSEKMSNLGELVAGVAHEINNPVGFIKGNLSCLKDYSKDLLNHLKLYQAALENPSKDIVEHAKEIDITFLMDDLTNTLSSMHAGVDRIQNISTSLRTFARSDHAHTISFDVHDGIDSTLLILKHRLKANEQRPAITIQKHYGELPDILCFPGQLNQVFMNILANAIDALDESNQGKTFADIEANPNQITIQTELLMAEEKIAIRLSDNGPGIPTDIQRRIFENLFTTKPVGKGTGLGLAITRQIIEETHQGQLSFISELGQGTTFLIQLPLQLPAIG